MAVETRTPAALIDALRPLASQVTVKAAYWIGSPDGELYFNNGSDFCRSCAMAIIRHKRRRDRANRDEYRLDGGWRSEHDNTLFCSGCGSRLDGSLTDYAIGEELAHYREGPPRPGCIEAAYDMTEVLTSLQYSTADADDVAEACAIAERILETPA